jgi:hypothetical protein
MYFLTWSLGTLSDDLEMKLIPSPFTGQSLACWSVSLSLLLHAAQGEPTGQAAPRPVLSG